MHHSTEQGKKTEELMPEFSRLHDHMYTHSYSDLQTNKFIHSDLQGYMSGILNTMTLHSQYPVDLLLWFVLKLCLLQGHHLYLKGKSQ